MRSLIQSSHAPFLASGYVSPTHLMAKKRERRTAYAGANLRSVSSKSGEKLLRRPILGVVYLNPRDI